MCIQPGPIYIKCGDFRCASSNRFRWNIISYGFTNKSIPKTHDIFSREANSLFYFHNITLIWALSPFFFPIGWHFRQSEHIRMNDKYTVWFIHDALVHWFVFQLLPHEAIFTPQKQFHQCEFSSNSRNISLGFVFFFSSSLMQIISWN